MAAKSLDDTRIAFLVCEHRHREGTGQCLLEQLLIYGQGVVICKPYLISILSCPVILNLFC